MVRKQLSVTHLLAAQYQKLNCLAVQTDKWVKNDIVQLILFGRGTGRPHFNGCINWLCVPLFDFTKHFEGVTTGTFKQQTVAFKMT